MSLSKEMNVSAREKILILTGIVIVVVIIWAQLAKMGKTMNGVSSWMDSTNIKIEKMIMRMDSSSARAQQRTSKYKAQLDSITAGMKNLGAYE